MAGEFKLEQVLPWGRNRSEYAAFFDLGALDIGTRILDCASGPSSFNAEMADRGYRVVSTDPLYQFSESAIAGRVEEARAVMLAGLRAAKDRFVLSHFGTPERVVEVRLATVRRFLEDYESGRKSGRYLVASLPRLPFADGQFDLVLCSHFLFLYSVQLDAPFHLAAIEEMMRVGWEARVFPLLDMDGQTSRHLAPTREKLERLGYASEIHRVDYEFQKGGHNMSRVTSP